jgi:membrane protein DedA with SNARE-associated domain
MDLNSYVGAIVDFIRQNQVWGPPIVAALAFGESVVILSFFVPAVAILFALGAAAGAAGGIAFWPLWSGIVVGAGLGNLISWWIGIHYGHHFKEWRPIRERPHILAASESAIKRWGVFAIFIGRFFGPLHGTVATLAAIGGLNPAKFHVANWASAMVWAGAILYSGMAGGEMTRRMMMGG